MTFSCVRHSRLSRFINSFLIIIFIVSMVFTPRSSYAAGIQLPQPGTMVNLSPQFTPAVLHGVIIYPKDPLRFDFIVDPGNSGLQGAQLTQETTKLVKYFLAGIAIPDEDLWVNLSPYERSRIIPQNFGVTDMGRDLLSEDYLLKQLTATLIYPEKIIGKKFWDMVYQKARAMYGTTSIPVNTFNKVWIVPDKAVVYQHENRAFIAESHLKVMLEEDFLALEKNQRQPGDMFPAKRGTCPQAGNYPHALASEVVRQIVLPLLEKEINEGNNFAPLRQVFSAVILAHWYKQSLKESLVNQVYANSKKVNGIDIADIKVKEKIYQQYLESFKKGVYNYIKEDYDPALKNSVSRKYFSGGCNVRLDGANFSMVTLQQDLTAGQRAGVISGSKAVIVPFALQNAQMASRLPLRSSPVSMAMTSEKVKAEIKKLSEGLPHIHEVLKRESTGLLGNLPMGHLEGLIAEAKEIKAGGKRDIVIETTIDTNLAKLLLQSGLDTGEWNLELAKKGLPQIHFIDANEGASTEIQGLQQSKKTVSFRPGQFDSNTLALFIAAIIDEKMARAIYEGARDSVAQWKGQEKDLGKYSPYALALRQVAYAKTGKNVSVLTMFGKKYRYYSIWLAHQMNQLVGNAKIPLVFSGEWASDFRHSTGQAHNQAIGYGYTPEIAKAEEDGFIGLTFINAEEGKKTSPAVVQGIVNPQIRGHKFDLLLQNDREAQRISVSKAKRPVFDWTFNAQRPQDIGKMIVYGQISALATAVLAGADINNASQREQLETALRNEKESFKEITPIPNGILREEQNIINIEGYRLTGIVGERIQQALSKGDRKLFELLVSQVARLAGNKTGLEKVLGDLKSKDKLIHLDPQRSIDDVEEAQADANVYKRFKRIYVAAVGGSVFGDHLQHMLSMADGPEIIFVTDYDGDQMKVIEDDLRRNPETTAVFEFSKSGVTREVAANGATMREILWKALEGKGLSQDHIAEHFFIVTDPSNNDLRALAERLGIRTANHPEHGGRFSMLSILGQVIYFLKGGSKEELLQAFNQWKLQNDTVKRISKDFSDKKLTEVLNINLDKIRKIEDEKQRHAQLEVLSRIFGRSITLETLPTQQEIDDKKIQAISYIFAELKKVSGIIPGFCRTFLNIMHQADDSVRYDTEIALSNGGGISRFVTPQVPGYQQLIVESLGKPESRQYSIVVAGLENIKDDWERIVANRRAFVTVHTEQPNEIGKARVKQAEKDVLWKELTAAGVPVILTENGEMNTSNLVASMVDFYWHIAIAAAQYRSVDGEGQAGVEDAKQNAEALMGKINEEVAREAIRSGKPVDDIKAEWTRVPQLSLEEIDHANEREINLEMIADPQLAENIKILLTDGKAGSEGLATVALRDGMLFNPNPKQKYEILNERIRKLVKEEFQGVSSLIIDGQEEKNGVEGPWVVRATTIQAPLNLDNGASCGTTIEFYRKNESGVLEAKPVASIMIQWGSSLRVFVSNGKQTQDYQLLVDGRLIEVTKPGENNLIRLSTIGKYISIGGESLGIPEGFRHLMDSVIRPSTKLKDRHTGDLVADNNLMTANQGFFADWMTWGEAYNIAQFQEGVGGFALVMTDTGLRPISDFPVTEDRLKDQNRIFVYAGVQNLVRQTQLWMDLLEPLTKDDKIFKFLYILESAPDAAKPTAIMLLHRIKEGLDAFPGLDKLEEGPVKEMTKRLLQRVPEVLEHLDEKGVISRLQAEYIRFLATPVSERHDNEDKFLILADPKMLTQTKIGSGASMREFYRFQRKAKSVSTGELISKMGELLVGNTSYSSFEDIQRSLLNFYQQNKLTSLQKPIVLPAYRWGQSLDDYRSKNMTSLAPDSGVPPETAAKILQKRKEIEDEITNALTGATYIPEIFEDEEQKRIIDELREEEPGIFQRDGENHEYIPSLLSLLQNLAEKKATTSLSTDVSSRLDEIFNKVFNFRTRPKVFGIISEENIPVVYGVGVSTVGKKKFYAFDIDGYRLVLFSDPIDGSSGVATGMAFGSIFTLGYLTSDQDLEAGDFRKRTQLLSGFHLQYSHSIDLNYFNPYDSVTHRSEYKRFGLHKKRTGSLEFRYKEGSDYPNFWESESNLEWDGGLQPKPDKDPQKAIHLALGGAFLTAEIHHKVFMDNLIKTYGSIDTYGGAFLNDHVRFFSANLSHQSPFGRMYAYGLDEGKGRLRDPFEIFYMSSVLKHLGGEAIDGIQPTLSLRIEGKNPSQKQIPYLGGSAWITKKYVAWDFYVKQNSSDIDLRSEKSVREAYKKFEEQYIKQGKRLLGEMVEYSRRKGDNKDEMAIRRQLLSWDSEDLQDNYFPHFLDRPGQEVYEKIFADHAQTANHEDLTVVPLQDPGGIHLGVGDYLKVVKYTASGMPVFSSQQLREYRLKFNGFVPVAIGSPRPADLVTLSGL